VCAVPFNILAYLENGRLETEVCLNQILIETGGKTVETFKMV
jgi:hypothetical protein